MLGLFVVAKAALVGLLIYDGLTAPPGADGQGARLLGQALRSAWSLPALLDEDLRALLLYLLLEAVLGVGGFVVAAAWGPRRVFRAGSRWAAGPRLAALGALGALGVYTAVNVPVARVMGTPLTYTILRTVGGALSDSIRVYFTAPNLLAVLGVLAAAVGLGGAARRRSWRLGARGLLVSALLLAVLLLLGPRARRSVDLRGLPRNAAYTLITTTLQQHLRTRAPVTLPPLPPADASAPATGPATEPSLSALQGAARGRSVLWIVLESTAAQYLRPFGAARDPMPTITQLAAEGVRFDAAYAAYPESIKGLFSLLCAAAPAANTPVERYTAAMAPCSPLAEPLRAVGYRTALFHSGWFAYLGMLGVVEGRGFDVLADAGTIGGAYATSFGVDEQSTVQRLLQFIDGASAARRPFFAMYLPIAGHHPYSSPGPEPRAQPFGRATEQDTYLNDLNFGDKALGALRAALKQRGLDEQILWIVTGDHGEAFQQHPGNFAHTLHLYDENVRIPLIVAAPGLPALVRGSAAPQVASLIDVAPTLLDLLGLRPPGLWQGRSLLRPPLDGTEPVARFLTDHGLLQLGLRHGPWKLIDEVETGRGRLFNLREDPAEQHDLAAQQPERVRAYQRHLRAWSDAQRARLQPPRWTAE